MSKGLKIVGGVIGLALLLLIAVAMSGVGTKEVQVGVYKADYNSMGTQTIIQKLPEGTTSVRVVYELKDATGYGMANGNVGIANGNLPQGADPFMNGDVFDSKYLDAGNGPISGELKFTGGENFVYTGMFDGTFTVYATVPA